MACALTCNGLWQEESLRLKEEQDVVMEEIQGLTQTFEALQAGRSGTNAELDELKTLMDALNDEIKVGPACRV